MRPADESAARAPASDKLRSDQPARRREWVPPVLHKMSVVDTTLTKGAAGVDVDMESS